MSSMNSPEKHIKECRRQRVSECVPKVVYEEMGCQDGHSCRNAILALFRIKTSVSYFVMIVLWSQGGACEQENLDRLHKNRWNRVGLSHWEQYFCKLVKTVNELNSVRVMHTVYNTRISRLTVPALTVIIVSQIPWKLSGATQLVFIHSSEIQE